MNDNAVQQKKKMGCLTKILIAIAVIFVLSLFSNKDNDDKKTTKTEESAPTSVEKAEATKEGVTGVEVKKKNKISGIEAFEYTIDGDEVKLEKYVGKDETVELQSKYTIDGNKYKTDISDFQIGIGNSRAKTVIIDEGFTEVPNAIFNSCDVQRIFFPKSMETVYDYTLSYLIPEEGSRIKIYYAGTQDEWGEIFKEYKRTKVEDAEGPEEKGAALADKLNEMMGSEYDSSQFEYFFSASPDDLR